MPYIKLNQDGTKTYPYDPRQIHTDYPQVSFPETKTPELLASYGVYEVLEAVPEVVSGRIAREKSPEFIEGRWRQVWILEDPTQDEISAKEFEIRSLRDAKLTQTDWVVAKAYERQIQVPENYKQYRQALRDITTQPGFPWEVIWPTLVQ